MPYPSRNSRKLAGFTLAEILIVVTLIAILASISLITNIKGALQKARDSNRKTDLNKMVRILEDYYNDNQKYPAGDVNGNITNTSWGAPFLPYTSSLPKDPLSPNRQYYYYADNVGLYYLIYAKLENTGDPDIERVGCKDGCAPPTQGIRDYSYVVHSPNLVMIAGLPSIYGTGGGSEVFPTPGGGGGGGAPTATFTPPPPTPTTVPGTCTNNECCCNRWCGASSPPAGAFCVAEEKCLYDNLYMHWTCGSNQGCPPC